MEIEKGYVLKIIHLKQLIINDIFMFEKENLIPNEQLVKLNLL
jgi:hypothetical protein